MLRHLFGLLHAIYRESDINQMTSHNLAVCWGPNLLTSLSSSGNNSGGAAADDEMDASAAVEQLNLLVDFLIVQAPRVFGDDCLNLLSDLARSVSMDEDTNELYGRTQGMMLLSTLSHVNKKLNSCTSPGQWKESRINRKEILNHDR